MKLVSRVSEMRETDKGGTGKDTEKKGGKGTYREWVIQKKYADHFGSLYRDFGELVLGSARRREETEVDEQLPHQRLRIREQEHHRQRP